MHKGKPETIFINIILNFSFFLEQSKATHLYMTSHNPLRKHSTNLININRENFEKQPTENRAQKKKNQTKAQLKKKMMRRTI